MLLITPHIHKTASTMLKSVESVDAAAAGSGAAVSLELASRFRLLAGLSRQQQQGRPALQQRLAGVCAQHKHGGAPHACTTVQCQNHSQGQTVHWGVSHTQRGHAPSSSNLRRDTAWQRALKRADIVAPRSTLILAHAHKRALHAPQCCMV